MRGSSRWEWMTYNFTDEEHLCVTPSRLNHVSARKHVCWEALVSPLVAAEHYSGLFMSSDVVSTWNHMENATLLDSKITSSFNFFESLLVPQIYTSMCFLHTWIKKLKTVHQIYNFPANAMHFKIKDNRAIEFKKKTHI